jgi:hypothetical protein
VPVKPPSRAKALVCEAVPGSPDAVALRWEHNPTLGDTPTSEYIVQCRRMGKQHGARSSGREWVHRRHRSVLNGSLSDGPRGTRRSARSVRKLMWALTGDR